jgi:hypothetical protein
VTLRQALHQYGSSSKNSKKPFTNEEKRAAVELRKAKFPLKNIREQLQMSVRTLRRILSHAKSNPANPVSVRKKGSGRIPRMTPHILQTVRAMILKTPTLTAKQLKGKIPELADYIPELADYSIRHIQRLCLKRLELPSRRMANKPLLNERMKQQRLDFAMQYRDWTVDQWKNVMFSDESRFELHFGKKEGRCRRPRGSDRMDPKFTKKTVKHPEKVMVWGCFSWRGRGGLEFLNRGEMLNGAGICRFRKTSWSFS